MDDSIIVSDIVQILEDCKLPLTKFRIMDELHKRSISKGFTPEKCKRIIEDSIHRRERKFYRTKKIGRGFRYGLHKWKFSTIAKQVRKAIPASEFVQRKEIIELMRGIQETIGIQPTDFLKILIVERTIKKGRGRTYIRLNEYPPRNPSDDYLKNVTYMLLQLYRKPQTASSIKLLAQRFQLVSMLTSKRITHVIEESIANEEYLFSKLHTGPQEFHKRYTVYRETSRDLREKMYETIRCELEKMRIFNFDDIVRVISEVEGKNGESVKVGRKRITRILDSSSFHKISPKIYTSIPCDLHNQSNSTEQLLILAKNMQDSEFLGFTAAMVYHSGVDLNPSIPLTLAAQRTKPRVSPRIFQHRRFIRTVTDDLKHFIIDGHLGNHSIRVSSKERTFVDCIGQIALCGGWGEITKHLMRFTHLDVSIIIDYLCEKPQGHIRRVGLLLELGRHNSIENWCVKEDHLETLASFVKGSYLSYPQKLSANESYQFTRWKYRISNEIYSTITYLMTHLKQN